MPHRVQVQQRARLDLFQIYSYIAEHNPDAAQVVFSDIKKKTLDLADAPYSGAPRDDLGAGLRHLVIGSYLAFYRVEDETVQVLRYLHGARNLSDTV